LKTLSHFLVCAACYLGSSLSAQGLAEQPGLVLENQTVKIYLLDADKQERLLVNGAETEIKQDEDKLYFEHTANRKETLRIEHKGKQEELPIKPMPLFWSIVPPLVAIVLAMVLRETLSSLFIGILVGLMIMGFYSGGLIGILESPIILAYSYFPEVLLDRGHISVILFCMITGSMVAIISKNGGMQGVVNKISKFATTRMSAQLATFFAGIIVFFDDYANSLVVGNTMRSLMDKMKVSREKLAYIVDSTSAPIAAVALVTTWIGAELEYISGGINYINESFGANLNMSAYAVFLKSLPYSFYTYLTLFFVVWVIVRGKDFGPMLQKERLAVQGKAELLAVNNPENDLYQAEEGIKTKSIYAIIPIVALVLATLIGLLVTGNKETGALQNASLSFFEKMQAILGAADSYAAILVASFLGLMLAFSMTVIQNKIPLHKSSEYALGGMKSMLGSVLILVLAWTLANITKTMHTADFLIQVMQAHLPVHLVPALTFVLATLIAFSTGTSWGTMAIVFPLVIPLAWKMSLTAGLPLDDALPILYNSIACVLAGAVFGDHFSPISDTTILSSLASSCNHIEHVRTQMPYALLVGTVSLVFGVIPSSFGISPYISLICGALVLVVTLEVIGKKAKD
jgi:Na+/H+ antiporter NhaC